jgi:hypothetical protein
MNEIQIARQALEEIARLYLRSNKRGQNTCQAMYRRAIEALEIMEQPTRPADLRLLLSEVETMTLEEIKQLIKELDPNLSEEGP